MSNSIYVPVKERGENVTVKCKCGCGKEFLKYSKRGCIKLFIEGHNNRGKKFPNKLGYKHTEEQKLHHGKKMEEWHIVNKDTPEDKERRKKIGISNSIILKGRKLLPEHKKNVLIALKINSQSPKRILNIPRGEKHCRWNGGISTLNDKLRKTSMFRIWREAIFLRDNFTCQNSNCKYCSNKIGVYLHPHHIKSLSLYPELAYNVENGITYCKEFHLNSGLHKGLQNQGALILAR